MSESTIILPYAETIWKPIPEWEDYYEASNTGLIKGIGRTVKNRNTFINVSSIILKPKFDKDCYLGVKLMRGGGKERHYRVQRLIAITFIPNPDNLPLVDHINQVRWDNRATNLRWVTESENSLYSFANGRTIATQRAINQYTLDGFFVRRYEAIKHVEKMGFNSRTVNDTVLGRQKTSAGFIWKYAD